MALPKRFLLLSAALLPLVLAGCVGDGIEVSVNVSEADNVTPNSAHVLMEYTAANATIVTVGCVYSTKTGDLNVDAIKAYSGVPTEEFGIITGTPNVSGQSDIDFLELAGNTTYYYKAFIRLDKHTGDYPNGYFVPSEYKSFTTPEGGAPEVSVSVSDADRITLNSAYVVMEYSAANARIAEVGAVYSTRAGELNVDAIKAYGGVPTADFGIASGSPDASGTFDADFLGLTEGTTYYYKAFVKLSRPMKEYPSGYVITVDYKTFATPETSAPEVSVSVSDADKITPNSAYVVVEYSAVNARIAEVGCVYGTRAGTLNVDAIMAYDGATTADFGIASGSPDASGTFDADFLGLAEETTYYYKAFIKLDKPTKEYPNGYFVPVDYKSFKTSGIDISVSVSDADNITPNSAYIVMEYSVVNAKILEVGCVYSTRAGNLNVDAIAAYNGTPTADFGIVSGTPNINGRFDADFLELAGNTTYYYKPFIKHDKPMDKYPGGYYVPFEYKRFQTPVDNAPAVMIGDVTGVTGSTATFSATVMKAGTPPYIEKGFCYGTERKPAKGASITIPDTGTSSAFTYSVEGLTENVTYYVRAYIDNGDAVRYSAEKEFTTVTNTLVYIDTAAGGRAYRIQMFDTDMWMIQEYKGKEFTWSEAMTVCPSGWHLPSVTEWNRVISVLGGAYSDSLKAYFPSDRNLTWWSSSADVSYGNYAYSYSYRGSSSQYLTNDWTGNGSVGKSNKYAVRCVRNN